MNCVYILHDSERPEESGPREPFAGKATARPHPFPRRGRDKTQSMTTNLNKNTRERNFIEVKEN